MDIEEELIGQIGLLFTQLRYTRLAVEQIERSTARYGGADFTAAFAAGTRFGEPPLLDGALKVYVVNINDLTSGGGGGGFLETLLGSVGRFFGGLFGGIVGGAISGVSLPWMVAQLTRLAGMLERTSATIERVLARFEPPKPAAAPAAPTGAAGATPAASTPAPPVPVPPKPAEAGGLLSNLEIIKAMTALFQAASSGPEAAAQTSNFASTEAGNNWMAQLRSISELLAGINRIIEGLIILVLLLLGTLAALISRFDGIKLLIIDLLEFIFRNVFLVRGVVLVTLYDTAAAIVTLAASILGILGVMIDRVLASVFRILDALLGALIETFRFIAGGLQRTIDGLLRWLIGTLAAVLTFIGDLRIFRVIVHIIQTLPLIIPALYQLIYGKPIELTPKESGWLQEAASRTIPGPSGPGGPGSTALPSLPNLGETLFPAKETADFRKTFVDTGDVLRREAVGIVGAVQSEFKETGQALNDAAKNDATNFGNRIDDQVKAMNQHAGPLTQSLTQARQAAPQTGLEAIAQAYESWLSAGGLSMILGNITHYFRETPTQGSEGATSLLGRIVGAVIPGLSEQPRATVEIEEVIIDVAPPPTPTGAPTSSSMQITDDLVSELMQAMYEKSHEDQQRGLRIGQGSPLAFS